MEKIEQDFLPKKPFPQAPKVIRISKEIKQPNEFSDTAMIPQKTPYEYFQNSETLNNILGISSNIYQSLDTDKDIKYFSCYRGNFLGAFWMAYNKHGDITISPDDIWIQILKGLSQHINFNYEKLRSKIVDFEGQKDIQVILSTFEFNMQEALNLFQLEIEKNTSPKIQKLLKGNFSTTGLIEQFVQQIALMETCKKYFRYICRGGCGIQQIHFLGKIEDWKLLKEKVQQLKEFDCEWWINELELVIDKLIQTYNNDVDYDFWDKIFSQEGTKFSGEINHSIISIGGWFNVFYPYIKTWQNAWFKDKSFLVLLSDFSDNFFNVPFSFNNMECVLLAGFSGIYELNNNFRLQLSAALGSVKNKQKEESQQKEFQKQN